MQLHLLRHADAGDAGDWHGPDSARPLSPEGVAQAQRLGTFLAAFGFRTEAFLSSPNARALHTAEIVAGGVGAPVCVEKALAKGLDLKDVERLLASQDDPASVVLVGHDPDFTQLFTELVGASDISMKKGAMARIDVHRPLRPGAGRLRWLVPPELLAGQASD